MANKGSYAAYKQLTPLGNGIAEDMQYWNNDGYRRRAEDRIDEANKIAAEEKKKKEDEALRTKVLKNLKNYDTGSKSLNEIQGRLLQEAMNEYVPILETLNDPNKTEEEKLKAELKLMELHNLPENMKMVTETVTERHNNYLKGIQDGTIFRDLDYEKKFQNGYEAFALSLDDNGRPVLAYRDVDGDNVNDIESYEEIKTGLGKFEFQKRYNIDDLAVAAEKDIGKSDIKEVDKGNVYKTSREKQIKLDEVRKYAENTMKDERGQLTDVAKSELRTRGLEPTPENLELITKDFEELIISKSDYLKEEDYDTSSYTSRLNAKDKNAPTPKVGEGVTPSKGNWSAWYGQIDTGRHLSVPVEGVKLEAVRNYAGKDISGLNVENYTYDKKGKLLLDGYVQEEKTITKEDYERQRKEAQRTNNQVALTMLDFGEIRGDKVVVPGAKKKVQIRVNEEDEANVALSLNMSIDEMRSRATVPEDQQKENNDPLNLGI